jgi:hypothetical protein
LLAHQQKHPKSILAERPDAPKRLVEICRRMMAKKPDLRIQSAAEVHWMLAEWLAEQGQKVKTSLARSSRAVGVATGSWPGRPGGAAPARPESPRRPAPAAPRERSPSLHDTVSDVVTESTIKGRGRRPGDSQKEGSGKGLPVARPLADAANAATDDAFDEFTINLDLSATGRSKSLSGKSTSPSTPGLIQRRQTGRTIPSPPWIWIVIGIGALVAIGMIVAMFASA